MSDTIWRSVTERYSRFGDCIELIDQEGNVVAKLHRNAVIRMLGMFPPDPPDEDETP